MEGVGHEAHPARRPCQKSRWGLVNDRVQNKGPEYLNLELLGDQREKKFVNSIGVSERKVVFEVRDLGSRSPGVWIGRGNKIPRVVVSFEVFSRVLFTLAGSSSSLWRAGRILIG